MLFEAFRETETVYPFCIPRSVGKLSHVLLLVSLHLCTPPT